MNDKVTIAIHLFDDLTNLRVLASHDDRTAGGNLSYPTVHVKLILNHVLIVFLLVLFIDTPWFVKPTAERRISRDMVFHKLLEVVKVFTLEIVKFDDINLVTCLWNIQHAMFTYLTMNVDLVHNRLENVNGRYLKCVNSLNDILSLALIVQIIIQILLDSFRFEIAELLDIANASWTAKQVAVKIQIVRGEKI